MAVYNKFFNFVQAQANGHLNLGADVLKVMLTNTLPVATNAVKADISEIAAGNGYSAGGNILAIASSLQVGGVYILLPSGLGTVTFAATSGSFGPFRYAVLYDSTPVGGILISWYDYGSQLTLTAGSKFLVVFPTVTGVLQEA